MVATLSTMEHAVVAGGEVSGPKKDNVAMAWRFDHLGLLFDGNINQN